VEEPRVVAVCGEIGSGKSTVAAHLQDHYCIEPISIADPMKAICRQVFDLALRHTHGSQEDKLEPLDHVRGPAGERRTPREILQWVGTEGFRTLDPDVWIKMAVRQAEQHLENGFGVCFTDTRFENEFEAVRRLGGVIWLVETIGNTNADDGIAGHASEAEWRATHKDAILLARAGDLEGLRREVDEAMAVGGRRHQGILR